MKCLRQAAKHAADSNDIDAVSVLQAVCFTPQGFSICMGDVQYQSAVFFVAKITARTCQLVHVMPRDVFVVTFFNVVTNGLFYFICLNFLVCSNFRFLLCSIPSS